LLRLVVIFCFFNGSRGVGVGDVKWNVFHFVGCFIAAASASSTSGDDEVERGCGSGLIVRGMGSEWGSFKVDVSPEDRIFVINWDHDCFMVDVDGIEVFSRLPSGPVVSDIEVSSSNEGSEEVKLVVVSVHADKDDSIVGAQGEDGRGSES